MFITHSVAVFRALQRSGFHACHFKLWSSSFRFWASGWLVLVTSGLLCLLDRLIRGVRRYVNNHVSCSIIRPSLCLKLNLCQVPGCLGRKKGIDARCNIAVDPPPNMGQIQMAGNHLKQFVQSCHRPGHHSCNQAGTGEPPTCSQIGPQ